MYKFADGIIVCSNQIKKNILKSLSEEKSFYDYTFFTIEDLKKALFFKVKPRALFELVNKYQITYSFAKECLDGMYFIDDKHYNNAKLDSLVEMKKYLNNLSMIENDELIFNLLKRSNVTFLYYPPTKEFSRIVETVKKITSVEVINYDIENELPEIIEFTTIEDEVRYVFTEIKNLLDNNFNINDIYIVNAKQEYQYLIKRMSQNFEIDITIASSDSIISGQMVNSFLTNYDKYTNFDDLLKSLKLFKKTEFYNNIISIINNYSLINFDYITSKALFIYEFKKIKYTNIKFDKSIAVLEDELVFDLNAKVFYLGFNQDNSPITLKDDKFISDIESNLLLLDSTSELNMINKKQLICELSKIKNLVITYKLSSDFSLYFPSNLITEFQLKVIKKTIPFGISKIEDSIKFSYDLDMLDIYNEKSLSLEKYNTKHIPYKTFDNKYKQISKEVLNSYLKKPTKLSYSSLKRYFLCPFSYYLDRVLNLSDFTSNLAAHIGTFAHNLLEDSYKDNFNFDESVELHMKEAIDSKEKFYFSIMKEIVFLAIKFNNTYENISKLDRSLQEADITLPIIDGFILNGKIDKVKYTIIDDEVYIAIIDYKSGNDVLCLDNIEDGMNLQLPIYMYLISNYPDFVDKKINIIGIYLQKINIKNYYKVDSTSVDEQRIDSFKLKGYTINEPSKIIMFDQFYNSSKYIDKLKTIKSGDFAKSALLLDKKTIFEINSLVPNLLLNASEGIMNGNFPIIPKKIGYDDACKYCKHNDICFVTFNDKIEIEKKPFGNNIEEGDE